MMIPTVSLLRSGNAGALVFFLPALLSGYFTLSWFVNRLTVKLNDRTLSTGHGRLPVFGEWTITMPANGIEQLYIEYKTTDKSARRYYNLMVRYAGGRTRVLIKHHTDLPALEAVEQTLETALDIRDDLRMKLSPEGYSREELSTRLQKAEDALELLDLDQATAEHQRVTARHKVLAAREALEALEVRSRRDS